MELRADCTKCAGLCCVGPAFAKSADFAFAKPAGRPCPNLAHDFRCTIHSQLRPEGFAGCTVFDCFGAGQQVTQITFAGQDWRQRPESADQMSEAFAVMRTLHELLWYLTQALAMRSARRAHAAMADAVRSTTELTLASADELAELDVDAQRSGVNALLLQASELIRSDTGNIGPDYRGADLAGQVLRDHDLRRASLRGARLIGTDLRDVDLELADLTGADLRGADIRGARLSGALFVTQSQLHAALGDARTTLPAAINRPAHWNQTSR